MLEAFSPGLLRSVRLVAYAACIAFLAADGMNP